jgi:hypothetical protein
MFLKIITLNLGKKIQQLKVKMKRRILKINNNLISGIQQNKPIKIKPLQSDRDQFIDNKPIKIKPLQSDGDQFINNTPIHKTSLNELTHFLKKSSNRCFILGGGPSLTNMDLSFLNNEDVICVNKSIDLVKNPMYFITMDYSFFNKIGSSIKEITARAKSSHFIINKQHTYIQKIDGVYTDTRTNLKYNELNMFSSVISSHKDMIDIGGFGQSINEFSHGNNSGYCAIQFAILAGYTEIYLLGFDLTESSNKEKTHFHNSYPALSLDKFYKNLNLYKKNILGSITRIKRIKPINFYTLTPSALEPIVPMISVKDLNKKNKKVNKKEALNQPKLNDLVIVAYYTLNTPYEEEAKKLIKSLNKLGLNHDVVGVPNLGNWQANTRFKAKFMYDMLDKHQGKSLLYVDSDAIVHSAPILFENYNVDIAVRWQDFRWRKNECLSGTIFMANNKKTRELCRRWQKININEGPNATTFEQWNLGSVIKEMEAEGKIKTDNLPPEYTMIFDSMRAMYPNIIPVIEHFQASRKFRSKI